MLAEQVRRSLRAPINIAGQEIVLTASIGIAALRRPDEEPAQELLREAEIAMYRAKRSGSDRIEIFKRRDAHREGQRVAHRERAAARHREAAARLVYQPIYLPLDRGAGGLRGAGALGASAASARSTRPSSCPSPRRSDLIVKLGSYVLGRAVREAARWQKELPRPDDAAVRQRQRFEPPAVHGRSSSRRCATSSAAP